MHRLRRSVLDFIARLNAEGIGTSVYYPQPVPRMTYYRDKYGWRDGAFPWPPASAIV